MKDIVFSVKQQKIEIKLFLTCFVIAFLLNVLSIIIYQTEWSEIVTQLLWVLILSCVFYGLTIFFRLLYWICKSLIHKNVN